METNSFLNGNSMNQNSQTTKQYYLTFYKKPHSSLLVTNNSSFISQIKTYLTSIPSFSTLCSIPWTYLHLQNSPSIDILLDLIIYIHTNENQNKLYFYKLITVIKILYKNNIINDDDFFRCMKLFISLSGLIINENNSLKPNIIYIENEMYVIETMNAIMDMFHYNKKDFITNEKAESALAEFILFINDLLIKNNISNKHLCKKTLQIKSNKNSFNFYNLIALSCRNSNHNKLQTAIITILSNIYIHNFTYANSMEILIKQIKDFLVKYNENDVQDNMKCLLMMKFQMLFIKKLFTLENTMNHNNNFPIKYSFLIDRNAFPLYLNYISIENDFYIVGSFMLCSQSDNITLIEIKINDKKNIKLMINKDNNNFQIQLPQFKNYNNDKNLLTINDITVIPNLTYVFIFGIINENENKKVYFSCKNENNEYTFNTKIKSKTKINHIYYGCSCQDKFNFNGYLGPLIAFNINPKEYIYEFKSEYGLMLNKSFTSPNYNETYEKYTSINSNILSLLLKQQFTNQILFDINPLKYRAMKNIDNSYLYNIIENDYTLFQFIKSEGINYLLLHLESYYQLVLKYSSTSNNTFILNHM